MNITEWIENNWHISPDIQFKIIVSIVVVLVLWVFRFFALRLVDRSIKDVRIRYYWRTGIKNTLNILLLIILGSVWIDRFGSLATFLGLVTAGLAIALQDLIINIAGWVFILVRRPFELGDRIQIGDFAGDVIDIRFFQFTLNEIGNWVDADQSTGRIIHVPNGKVFKEPQANYTQSFSHIWNEIPVLLTFESNWQKAREILEKIVNEHAEHFSKEAEKTLIEASKKFMIFYSTITPIVYTSVKDSGVLLTLRYLCQARKRRSTENNIWEAILEAFSKCDDIDFAYPTQRIYYNQMEGKMGTTKPPNYPGTKF
jgi:small-conductance mechanosensitive channel